MGPKKADNTSKTRRLSQNALTTTEDHENQQCIGKFSADLEFCCREPSSGYSACIPVYIRGHPPPSSQIHSVSQQSGTPSGVSVTPSVVAVGGGAAEEQMPSQVKRLSRGRIPSISQSGILAGIDNDNKSLSILGKLKLKLNKTFKYTTGQDPTKSPSSYYKTFHLIRDSEFFRPKLLVDSIGNENEPIDQINALYMRAWRIDQRFIDILKRILPLQEQLHSLNFCFVGLNEQTMFGFVEVCQLIKNLKTVSLDGNPLAANYFHTLIEKDDLKIAHLSLRFCNITDRGAERLAHSLGNMSVQNWKLLTLTLTGNQIGDDGAKSLAKALRYNRTLISLNLSSNFITDKGACVIALVKEEIMQRRHLLSERYDDTHFEDMRNNAPSPTLSTISTKSRSGRDNRTDSKRQSDPSKRRKSISTKPTDKRHRTESDENRPPSDSKSDQKKGKTDGITARSASVNPRRSSEPGKAATNARKKKLVPGAGNTSKKSISMVKEEDEDAIDELLPIPMQDIERENPILELNEFESHNGEIVLKGNLVLLNLNLSRNYLTLTSVNEFLISIQYQARFININDASHTTSTSSTSLDFAGLCRLELKGMNDVSTKSAIYRSLETLLTQKNPSTRLQRIKERDAKELMDQQHQTIQVSQHIIPEKARASSSTKSTSQRPTSRLKDGH
ncbi:unnamed protein product [Rotaria magnacalcarata]|uniref:Leucine-rich repeat-containing protein 71 n=1 Tax=Rotaria magnacalcarata TaxID=392030 RepID=A0A819C5K6_9BILA|nr:unnamed protein product [Rotaria magnacalcarata]CAF4080267.1 unnamed protein product [Rotaria magnacalcarata]